MKHDVNLGRAVFWDIKVWQREFLWLILLDIQNYFRIAFRARSLQLNGRTHLCLSTRRTTRICCSIWADSSAASCQSAVLRTMKSHTETVYGICRTRFLSFFEIQWMCFKLKAEALEIFCISESCSHMKQKLTLLTIEVLKCNITFLFLQLQIYKFSSGDEGTHSAVFFACRRWLHGQIPQQNPTNSYEFWFDDVHEDCQ